MVDFDLEAPGLERYFAASADGAASGISVSFAPDTGGIIGLLSEAANESSGRVKSVSWKKRLSSISVPMGVPVGGRPYAPTPAKLDLLPSGQVAGDYSSRLAGFTWNLFFERQKGAEWLEDIRNQWLKEYEFILIDSRTGLTDTGGVCTVHFPDVLVVVFTTNSQSFEGALKVAQAAQTTRATYEFERAPLTVVPLVSRWEGDKEVDLAETWMKHFDAELPEWMASWLPLEFKPRQFIEKTRVPHVARFSFGEPLPVLTHSLTDAGLPGLSYDTLARLLEMGMQNCGAIIDPNYRPPVSDHEIAIGDDPKIRALVLSGTELHQEIARLARAYGNTSKELWAFLLKASDILIEVARFSEAEPLLRRASRLSEEQFGTESSEAAVSLNNLAQLLQATNRLAEAEPLMRRALAIDEASFGTDHPNVAKDLNNLAALLQATNRLAEAEPLMRRALAIYEASFGTGHPNVAASLNNLAALLQDTNRLAEAEPLMRRALAIDEASFGTDHPNVAIRLNNLAQLLQATNRLAEAEPLMRRVLDILLKFNRATGHEHPQWKAVVENYLILLAEMGRGEMEIEEIVRGILSGVRSPAPPTGQ
jgi:tetratricopeptide (TPR) repeat protein